MFLYVLLLFSTTGGVYLTRKNKRVNDIVLWIDCTVLILLLALRDRTCADDTLFYYDYFMNISGPDRFEFLYDLLNRIVHYATGNFQVLLLCNACLAIIPVFYHISKHTNRFIYVFLYQILALYAFNFAIMRQTIAMTFVMLSFFSTSSGIECAEHDSVCNCSDGKKKWIGIYEVKAWCYIAVAVLFHRTAVMYVPMLLLYKTNVSSRKVIGIVIGTILLFVCREQVVTVVFNLFFPDKAALYLDEFVLDFGIIPVVVFAGSIVCFLVLKKYFGNEHSVQTRFLCWATGYSLYIASCMCWIPATGRLNQYGYLIVMFLFGNMYESINLKTIWVKCIKIALVVAGVFFYMWQLSGGLYNIIPYILFSR